MNLGCLGIFQKQLAKSTAISESSISTGKARGTIPLANSAVKTVRFF